MPSSPLQTLTATPFHAATPSATPPPSPLASLTSKPFTPSPASPASLKTPGAGSAGDYFQGKEPSGSFLGVSDEKDPYSQRPYFAYRGPGDTATTTDRTRTAPKMNPEVAAPTPRDSFENPRMPEGASQGVRAQMGATSQEQLDHRMALALGGSNDNSNLKPIPTAQNQAAGKGEGKMSSDVSKGHMSLFQAQNDEAKTKGLPTPWTDNQVKTVGFLDSVRDAPDDSTVGTLRNTVLGIPKAADSVGKSFGQFGAGIIKGITSMYTDPSSHELGMESQLPNIPVLKQVQQGVLRTVEPMVEPLSSDAAAAIILKNPAMYDRFVDLGSKGNFTGNADAQELLHSMGESAPQVVGDTAQAVLGAYMPTIVGGGAEVAGKEGIVQALKTASMQGAQAGLTFGVAQAASSGSKDPKEIGAILLKSTVAGTMLNMMLVGGAHGTGTSVAAIADKMKPMVQDALRIARSPEGQRGFINVRPFASDDAMHPDVQAIHDAVTSGDHSALQEATRDYVQNHYDDMRQNYMDRSQEVYGHPNVVSADVAKEVIPGYDGTNADHYHEASTDFRDRHFQDLLESEKGKLNNEVLFSGGATGVGKTHGMRTAGVKINEHPIVVDSNLRGGSSPEKFQAAIDHGYNVRAIFTHRDPVESWKNGVLPRVKEEGRALPETEHVARHESVPNDVAAAHAEATKHGPDRMQVEHIDNTGGPTDAHIIPIDKVPKFDYNGLYERIQRETNAAEKDGRLTPEQAEAARRTVKRNSQGNRRGSAQAAKTVSPPKVSEIKTLPSLFQFSRRFEPQGKGGFIPEKVEGISKRFNIKRLRPVEVGIFGKDITHTLPNGKTVDIKGGEPYVISGHNRLEVMKQNLDKIPNPDDYVHATNYPGTEAGVHAAVKDSILTNVHNRTIKDVEILDNAINGHVSEGDLGEALDYDKTKTRFFTNIINTFRDQGLTDFWNKAVAPRLADLRGLDWGVLQERLNFVERIARKTGAAIKGMDEEQGKAVKDQVAKKINEFMSTSKVATLKTVENNISHTLDVISSGGFENKDLPNLFGDVTTVTEVEPRVPVQAFEKALQKSIDNPLLSSDVSERLGDIQEAIHNRGSAIAQLINKEGGLTANSQKTTAILQKLANMPRREFEDLLSTKPEPTAARPQTSTSPTSSAESSSQSQASEIEQQTSGSHTENNPKPQIRQDIPVANAGEGGTNTAQDNHESSSEKTPISYDKSITDANGGVEPPVNKGGMQAPQIDWLKAKDIAAIRLSTDTMERNVEKVFGDQAPTINKFLVEKVRANETDRAKFVTDLRKEIYDKVVKGLGIKANSKESSLVQLLGEGKIKVENVMADAPGRADDIQAAVDIFRQKYDQMWHMWNDARAEAGLGPIGKIENYFRHFPEFGSFLENFLPTTSTGKLPTAIAGITDYFKSRTPWSSAAMRRTGEATKVDAVGGLDNYLNVASRAIFHTDSVQRGRLLETYIRKAADATSANPDVTKRINLGNFVSNLNDWTNLVSGKQARLDRAVESVVGRPALAFMRSVIRRFGLNVIGGNVSAATTHSIPLVYTLATTDTASAVRGLFSTLPKPFMKDFATIGGQKSSFLTRRFATQVIDPTLGEKVGTAISKPFRWVDEFISHFAVASKFEEGIAHGLSSEEAMAQADNYAARVIGDRSTGNLPNLMNTKTLGMITQFQIEVNDNLRVLMHDVPKWAGGNPARVGLALTKFAVYSYMFNQVMQIIKGSGKGLDPINMGLTLAGLNDQGAGKTSMERLQAFGGELAGELPFTSVLTQGQYPVLQGIPIADAMKGDWGTAVQKFASAFASPVGGGVQLLKSAQGINAWRAGVVTDASGKTITPIPQTLWTLFQGTLFGKSAFPSVRSSNTELANLSALSKVQQATSKAKNQQASQIWQQIKGIQQSQGDQAAKDQLTQIADQDPDMAQRVLTAMKNDQVGMTKADNIIKSLGVKNGQRAAYIKQQLNTFSTNDEKRQYLLDLSNKKILTADVLTQVLAP